MHAARRDLPNDGRLATFAAMVVAWALWHGPLALGALAPLHLSYLVLWLGARLPGGLATKHDLSYGIYIYAFPLQQVMVTLGVSGAVSPLWFAALSLIVTAPAALASWMLVERPALRLRPAVFGQLEGHMNARSATAP
ncbi:hypothetical protein GCM10009817_37680 [Terrabacter lapilli]|uniref:Acyltransferase-like protein n=2 Tax=Terrabacter lapilli TaxID=436231 RepID=A0ABN2SSV7_9MICO